MSKTVNYTDEMTTDLVTAYTAADSDEARASVVNAYAEKFGKKVQSVRQKLSREGVYVKKARTTKAGAVVESKDDIVTEIAGIINEPVENIESLAKANKDVLQLLRDILENWEPANDN